MPPRRTKPKKKRSKRTADGASGESEVVSSQQGPRGSTSNQSGSTPANPEAEAQKTIGNTAFQNGNYVEAIAAYSKAIELDGSNHVYYSNRSAANLSCGRLGDALGDARRCVDLNPGWAKGYSRLGAALLAAGDAEEAEHAYRAGLSLEPRNAGLQEGLASAQRASGAARGGGGGGGGGATTSSSSASKPEPPKTQEDASATTLDTSPVIGIDLGTTFSCVAVWKDDRVEILPNASGDRTTPSIVAFPPAGGHLVGEPARELGRSIPERVIFDAKRFIGRAYDDPELQRDMRHFPFQVERGTSHEPIIVVGEKRYRAEEISALVLGEMKAIAERSLGHPVTRAVITVPAYFNDAQRNATKTAGRIAGLEVLRIINEPTAAALAYGLDVKAKEEASDAEAAKVLIFDLGGGTFDVSLLEIDDGIFEVKATAGDTHLGGEDFDNALVDWVKSQTRRRSGQDVDESPRAMKRLRAACERAKRSLSSSDEVTLHVDSVLADGGDLELRVSRAQLERVNKATFDRCLDTVKRVLRDADSKITDVTDVVLVGGSTRIPKIQEMLSAFFKGKELCRAINPDEAVAYGAAVQGAILSGKRHAATESLLLVDVTPLSLGIELTGKVMSVIIKRNSAIPCRASKEYTTDEDWQEGIEVRVFEGERATTDGNNLLGDFNISGIERAKRGVPKIQVSFELDANGILNVSAKDMRTGAHARTTISRARGSHSPEDIERMVQEAQRMRKEDEIRVEAAEARSQYRSLLDWLQERARMVGATDVIRRIDDENSWLQHAAEHLPATIVNERAESFRREADSAIAAASTA